MSSTALPRLLVLMGSGETSPTMTKTHRETLQAVGSSVDAVLLDTPAAFQENVDIVSGKAREYFAESLRQDVVVASLRRPFYADSIDVVAHEAALARIRKANWVFTGPGSPTYALKQWQAAGVGELFRAKLRDGGVVVLSSAAACTAGRRCVPVYEIYKVGQPPFWEDGLDLLTEFGFAASVIPHWDNAEGGNHDTRFCYLGARRLAVLEAEMDVASGHEFILGLDEHSAAVFDFDAAMMRVTGNGGVTVRRAGEEVEFASGATVTFAELAALVAGGIGSTAGAEVVPGPAASVSLSLSASGSPASASAKDPVAVAHDEAAARFRVAIDARQANDAVGAILDLDDAITSWARDPTQSVERDAAMTAATSLRRSLIVELGEVAALGTRDPRATVGPFVDALLTQRAAARAAKRFADSDQIRDALVAAGVELRDHAGGTEWLLPES